MHWKINKSEKNENVHLEDIANIREKYKERFLESIKINIEVAKLLKPDVLKIRDGLKTYHLSDILEKYKMIVYFPKAACYDCLESMFEQINSIQNINSNDILYLSDFYSENEKNLFEINFNLMDDIVYSIENKKQIKFIKKPIIVFRDYSNFVLTYDLLYKDLILEFI